MKLLITRPDTDAESFAREVARLGHETVLQPLLVFQPLDCDWRRIAQARGLIATSRNALRSLSLSGQLDASLDLPLFAVGEGTAAEARRLGFGDIRTGQGTAATLCDEIRASWPPALPLLHLSGEHRAFPLDERLSEAGFAVEQLTCYAMASRESFDEAVIGLFRARQLDGVIVMSPRTADIYITLCERHDLVQYARAVTVYALSQPVGDRFAGRLDAPVHVPQRPSKDALLHLLAVEEERKGLSHSALSP